jgi:hypothetical protein
MSSLLRCITTTKESELAMSTKEYVYSYYRVGKHITLVKTPKQYFNVLRYDDEVVLPKVVWKLLRLTMPSGKKGNTNE